MKKFLICFLFVTIFLSLTGCGSEALKYSFEKKKPNDYFYTDSLIRKIKDQDIHSILVLETNLRKEMNLKESDIETVKAFFTTITTKNISASTPELIKEPEFKFYIEIDDEKFVVNVFNEKYISVFPWDGSYKEDYIDMTSVKPLYNLYNLCKYLYK